MLPAPVLRFIVLWLITNAGMDTRPTRLRILTEKGNELYNEQVTKYQSKLKSIKSDLNLNYFVQYRAQLKRVNM